MLKKIEKKYNEIFDNLKSLNEYLYNNPEIGREEIKASKAHMEILNKNGFQVQKEYINIKTAYRADYKGLKKGPKICFMAEYDALPEIGHGCGHNILGVTSVGAGIILKKLIDIYGGSVVVLGTPAEENFGAKVDMAKAGVFDDIDVAIISHPTGRCHKKSSSSQAIEALEFKFIGKSAHAAGDPYNGINALDAVIQLFNGVNCLRQQTKSTSKIHGIISKGGEAANVIPDLGVANFYVREKTTKEMKSLSEKVKNCAKGAAIATGCLLEIKNYEYTFKHLITNESLSNIYSENLIKLGVEKIEISGSDGSTDAGDVSHVCPTIHSYFPISDKELVGHSLEFAQATITKEAYRGMKEAMFAMVLTGIDLITKKDLFQKVKEEFNEMKKNN
ncbi:M20 family metallopeptidase [Fusobacterium sp. MFO224]|uniref:M20 family metallopeptidase n=1 Tax=Fusobacterium sp. MFO224 TaxID=3378070 RepID=UPI003853E6A9